MKPTKWTLIFYKKKKNNYTTGNFVKRNRMMHSKNINIFLYAQKKKTGENFEMKRGRPHRRGR